LIDDPQGCKTQEIDDIVNGMDDQYKQVGSSMPGDTPIKVSCVLCVAEPHHFVSGAR
jgi:hypothetical protein